MWSMILNKQQPSKGWKIHSLFTMGSVSSWRTLDNANVARAARLLNLLLIWNGGRAKVFENFPALIQFLFLSVVFHMSHDMTKPTKWVCAQWLLRSAWASAQSDQGLLCLHKKPWALSYPLSAQWSDWADDLSLCWVHSHFVCHVVAHMSEV